jgi:prevent-host-death family protein
MKMIDLKHGVVPVSKAGSALASLIKRASENRQPIIITQKGYPRGVLVDIDLFMELQQLAKEKDQ